MFNSGFPKLPSFPARRSLPKQGSDDFQTHSVSRVDVSIASLDNSSRSLEKDKGLRFGQVADIVDFVRWTVPEDSYKQILTAGNSTRSVNLVKYDENGISVPGKLGKQSFTKTLDVKDFASKITSVSDARSGLVALGHGDGSLNVVKVEEGKLYKESSAREKQPSAISAVSVSEGHIYYGTEQGKIFVDVLDNIPSKRKIAEVGSGITSLYSFSEFIFLSGTTDGRVILFDLRDKVKAGVVNINSSTDSRKASLWANRYTDAIKSMDMLNENLISAGTNEGIIRFADIRNPDEDKERKCRLKTSTHSINQVKFSRNGDNLFYACCRDGFVKMDFNTLMGVWFDEHTNKPIFLLDEYYEKIKRTWFTDLPNVTSFDIIGEQLVISNKGGELVIIN
ncbi:hypothetical protein FO519_001401 [Halicephalobus sp. NKZ332]|nr:hypothetical protein FO519_001401 [Halicephalobus sp. NKZ332]